MRTIENQIRKLKFYHQFYNSIKNDEFFDDNFKMEIYSRYIKCKIKVDEIQDKLTTKSIAI